MIKRNSLLTHVLIRIATLEFAYRKLFKTERLLCR
jgi:hypothetical protein